jgi:RHS repeat-associated protein
MIMDSSNAVAQDRVGTNRANGARFYPFGDEITSTSNDREKFATYTRDSYTGLDYADQRFYASTYGRFNTPDPSKITSGSAGIPSDPSGWNMYSYSHGDPVNRIDPGGTDDCFPDDPLSCDSLGYCPPEFQFCSDGSSYLGMAGCGGMQADDFNPSAAAVCLSTASAAQNIAAEAAAEAAALAAEQAAMPSCEIGLFYRKAFNKHLPWNHTYLADSCGGAPATVVTIQADPGPVPKVPNAPTAPAGYLGPPWLVGVIGPAGTGPGNSNPSAPGNFQVGSWEPVSYQTLLNIGSVVLNYDYNSVQPYTLFPYGNTTYNSNSFVNTLNQQFGLGFAMPSTGRTPGWNNLVPNL